MIREATPGRSNTMSNTKYRIRRIKEKYGITNEGIAIKFGIPLRTVESWSAGKREAAPYLLSMIENALNKEKRNDT